MRVFLEGLGSDRHFPSNHAEAKALMEVSVHTQCVSDKKAFFLAATQHETNDKAGEDNVSGEEIYGRKSFTLSIKWSKIVTFQVFDYNK